VTVFVLSTFLYLSVASVIFLLALRFVHGISFGVVTTATGAIASDLVPEERKGEGIGYFAMSMNLAMVLGPFIG
ncbi:MFS transporter, partial [Acinetobacter baumannii]|uniref:MFS transporter n=1 Tax=Acinetobacter baumannii TaxID=470 RepID=UPI00129ED157